jgi:hypothetical protein
VPGPSCFIPLAPAARCGAMTPTETHDYLELLIRKLDSKDDSSVATLSAAEEHYFKALQQKIDETGACEFEELLREPIVAAHGTTDRIAESASGVVVED